MGPLSRIHESSSGISTTSTTPANADPASLRSAGPATTIVTGSKSDRAFATAAYSAFAASSCAPHSSRRHGQAISVRSCSAVSGGIRNPASAGVPTADEATTPDDGTTPQDTRAWSQRTAVCVGPGEVLTAATNAFPAYIP